MTLMDVAHDFAVVSILLAIGYFLRMKVKLFQRLFLPASIIGGLVGLIIGPQILGLYSPVYVTYTDSINEWSGCTAGRYLCLLIFGRVNGKNI